MKATRMESQFRAEFMGWANFCIGRDRTGRSHWAITLGDHTGRSHWATAWAETFEETFLGSRHGRLGIAWRIDALMCRDNWFEIC